MVSSNKNKNNKVKDKIDKEVNSEASQDQQNDQDETEDSDQDENETEKTEAGLNEKPLFNSIEGLPFDNLLPSGQIFLFGLQKLDYVTFEVNEYEFIDGKLVNIVSIGKDTISILKHKMHRKIYERATAKDTNSADNIAGTN